MRGTCDKPLAFFVIGYIGYTVMAMIALYKNAVRW